MKTSWKRALSFRRPDHRGHLETKTRQARRRAFVKRLPVVLLAFSLIALTSLASAAHGVIKTDVIEEPGAWFFPPVAAAVTADSDSSRSSPAASEPRRVLHEDGPVGSGRDNAEAVAPRDVVRIKHR